MVRSFFRQCFSPRRPRIHKSGAPPRNRTRLLFETLEDRTVPTVLDLTFAGAEGTLQGAIYRDVNTRAVR